MPRSWGHNDEQQDRVSVIAYCSPRPPTEVKVPTLMSAMKEILWAPGAQWGSCPRDTVGELQEQEARKVREIKEPHWALLG